MDRLTFVSSIISALAWPTATTIIVFALKKPLIKLLLNIKHVKYKDVEFDFGKAVRDIQTTEPEPTEQLLISQRQLKLAELSPRGAILESWLELEEALARAAEAEGTSRTRPGGMSGKPVPLDSWMFAQKLAESGKLSASSYERFKKLQLIYNKAIHATDKVISQEDAETFIRLVAELNLEIRN